MADSPSPPVLSDPQAGALLDHFYLPVTDFERSVTCYRLLLRAIDITASLTLGDSVGFGLGRPGAFWVYSTAGRAAKDICGVRQPSRGVPPLHFALRASTRDQVQAFVAAAESLDLTIEARPRSYPEYHPNYFAAFIRDPDGHRVEVVCHAAT